jgi:hypothetical protein
MWRVRTRSDRKDTESIELGPIKEYKIPKLEARPDNLDISNLPDLEIQSAPDLEIQSELEIKEKSGVIVRRSTRNTKKRKLFEPDLPAKNTTKLRKSKKPKLEPISILNPLLNTDVEIQHGQICPYCGTYILDESIVYDGPNPKYKHWICHKDCIPRHIL